MKHSYHTNLIIRYKLGVLEDDMIKQIPNSTLYNWKQKGFSHIIGLPDVDDTEVEVMKQFLMRKKLMKAAKALYFVFSVYRSIALKFNDTKKIFRESKELIVQTVEQTKQY